MTELTVDDWKKLNLRVGEIKHVEDHPNADKLFVITVDLGKETTTIVAGLKEYYEPDDLIGKKVVVFVNLKSAELRGVQSDGMLLAAVNNNDVVLIGPDTDIENGAKVQ